MIRLSLQAPLIVFCCFQRLLIGKSLVVNVAALSLDVILLSFHGRELVARALMWAASPMSSTLIVRALIEFILVILHDPELPTCVVANSHDEDFIWVACVDMHTCLEVQGQIYRGIGEVSWRLRVHYL